MLHWARFLLELGCNLDSRVDGFLRVLSCINLGTLPVEELCLILEQLVSSVFGVVMMI